MESNNPYLVEEIIRSWGGDIDEWPEIARRLAATGRPGACRAIVSIARSCPHYVVGSVLGALASMGSVAFDAMDELARDTGYEEQLEAIDHIGALDDPRVPGTLVELMEASSDQDLVYDFACGGLAKIGDRSVLPRLVALAQSQSGFRKERLAETIEELS
jgi:hypothetical protein